MILSFAKYLYLIEKSNAQGQSYVDMTFDIYI